MARLGMLMLGALLLVGLGGCGGAETAQPTGPLTKSEYERAFKAHLKSAERESGAADDSDEPAQARALLSSLERLAKGLDAVQPPIEARPAHDDFVAGLRGYIAFRRPVVDALIRGDEAAAERLLDQRGSPALQAKILLARRFFETNRYDLDLGSSGLP